MNVWMWECVVYTLLIVTVSAMGTFRCSTLSDFIFVLTSYLTQMDGELCRQILALTHAHIQYGIRHGSSRLFFFLVKILCNKKNTIYICIYTYTLHFHSRLHACSLIYNFVELKYVKTVLTPKFIHWICLIGLINRFVCALVLAIMCVRARTHLFISFVCCVWNALTSFSHVQMCFLALKIM